MTRGSATIVGTACVLFALLPASRASAQDRAPETDDDRHRKIGTAGAADEPAPHDREPSRPGAEGQLNRAYVPYDHNDEAPLPDEPGTARPTPKADKTPDEEPTSGGIFDNVEVKTDGRVRLEYGYDSNVFRAEKGRTGDTFFHGQGEGNVLVRFPGERELYLSATGEGIAYSTRRVADEAYGSGFVDYYYPFFLFPIIDVELQDTFEYQRRNLLDDNGDLLPIETYNGTDEEARASIIAHVTDDLSLEVGGGIRWDVFERSPNEPALDFYEWRGNAGARFKIPWWPSSKLRVRYVFRERHYLELQADLRNGGFVRQDPTLILQRHQVIASYSQRAELPPIVGNDPMSLSIVASYTFTHNDDLFENDRSYREHTGSLRAEWWIVKDWTRLEGEVRGGTRSFLVRQTSEGAGLRQRFLDTSVLLWQKVYDHISIVGEAAWFLYRSSEVSDPTDRSYGRLVIQAGIEVFF